MKFVISYSGGKDSILALDSMIADGNEPVAMIVMYNKNAGRSYFHGINLNMLKRISESLNIPLIKGETSGEDYAQVFEKALLQSKTLGATACVFGDIDIEEHKSWNQNRCDNAGLQAILPLWQQSRALLVKQVIDLNYNCILKCICDQRIPKELLGKSLNLEMIDFFERIGVDMCGENGEYHTIVVDGPLFTKKINYTVSDIIKTEYVSAVDLLIL